MGRNGDGVMETGMVPVADTTQKVTNRTNRQAIIRAESSGGGYVPHLGLEEVRTLANAAGEGRNGERDRLLVQTLFDACLRVSEGLRLRPRDIKQDASGWSLEVFGKGGKPGVVAISSSLAAQMQAYAFRHKMKADQRFFPFTRTRAFQIVDEAMDRSGIVKPDHVGTVHVLRHSGALERLKATGNPRALQDQLRHASARMTLRYMKTLSAQESMRIQQGVDHGW